LEEMEVAVCLHLHRPAGCLEWLHLRLNTIRVDMAQTTTIVIITTTGAVIITEAAMEAAMASVVVAEEAAVVVVAEVDTTDTRLSCPSFPSRPKEGLV
jgi:hypothetical protein